MTAAMDAAKHRERMWSLYRNVLTEAEYKVKSEKLDLNVSAILRE